MNKLRTQEDVNKFRLALISIDHAFFESEQRWGVGRLERLQSPATLAAYQRGWDAYRVALDEGDAEAVEAIGPKMIAALAFMDSEATAAGHQPLAPDTWEASMGDGRVLVVCRTQAEASAVVWASSASDGLSAESTLPPDLAVTIRQQHEGRALTVVTMVEVARLLLMAEGKVAGSGTKVIGDRVECVKCGESAMFCQCDPFPFHAPIAGIPWDGSPAHSGVQQPEFMAQDIVRRGYPLEQPIAVDVPKSALLDF